MDAIQNSTATLPSTRILLCILARPALFGAPEALPTTRAFYRAWGLHHRSRARLKPVGLVQCGGGMRAPVSECLERLAEPSPVSSFDPTPSDRRHR